MIPFAEQKKVFKRPPAGVQKIILSTNIAKIAITIDDIVYVIDSCRIKEKSYDPYNNVSTLHSSWVSKSSTKQREGRAGHCEIARSPIWNNRLLQKTLDLLIFETSHDAIIVLQDIGALTQEKLTELGENLGALPVHPITSKMLLFSILMNCLEPALTLASAADYGDPFVLPMALEEKNKATTAKAELASLYGVRTRLCDF